MARSAVYPETLAGEISPERLRRFFVKSDRGYHIAKRVRDLCVFAKQNLCSDPPFSHIDILSCRNVMIYFNQVLQRQVISTFHYALKPDGYMLLGLSEGLRDFGEVFLTVDSRNKIYSKTGSLPQDAELYRTYRPAPLAPGKASVLEAAGGWPELELQRTADRIALARFAPAGMIVDERMNVLQLRGPIADFIEPARGAVSWNLQRVLRAGVSNGVWKAMQKAIHEGVAVSTAFTFKNREDSLHLLQVDVLPLAVKNSHAQVRCYLIFLRLDDSRSAPAALDLAGLSTDERDTLLVQQEHDLGATRIHLQLLIEERDGRNQELVAANEEIQAANELQSTNEELGTTKEELQSANEELRTVNDELHQRNLILTQTSNDLNNLLVSVNIPLLMVTSDLRIHQFTSPMRRLLRVRPMDIGRPISDIRLDLNVEDIEPVLREVLETLTAQELEVKDAEGRWHLLRVRPYRTADDKIEGVVLILMDVDQLRSSQQKLLETRDFARSVIECVPLAMVTVREDMSIDTTNNAFRVMTRMGGQELESRFLPDLLELLWGIGKIRSSLETIFENQPTGTFEMEHVSTTADRKIMTARGQTLRSDGHCVALVVMEDVTLRRQAEALLKSQKHDLEVEVASAAVTLDRTQEELRSLTAHLFSVQEEERQKVARELHDDISQRLSALDLILGGVAGSEGQERRIGEARAQLQALNTDVRQLSHQLHPAALDDLGLSAALKVQVDEFGQREGMPATYLSRNLPIIAQQPAATAIYRIVQEALRNVAKHAGKTHVKAYLEAEGDRLKLQISDSGIGFDQDAEQPGDVRGLGLISMKERAHMAQGSFQVQSKLGMGTIITVEVPFLAGT